MATEEKTQQAVAGSGEVPKIEEDEEGVLLYYKFVQILELEKTKTWLFDLSASLGLLGRIRVAHDGINVTVGGKMKALDEHIKMVAINPLFEGTDFKLATSVPNANPKVAAECGFTSLSARIVKELVTLGLPPRVEPPSLSMAGRHVTAQEFHQILQDSPMVPESKPWSNSVLGGASRMSLDNGVDSLVATRSVSEDNGVVRGIGTKDEASLMNSSTEQKGSAPPKKIVVVDARNIYETRIGKFRPPQGVQVMDPRVRQYSDLPRWLDDHEDHLRNNKILMYCTGGVRCEMASAYVRSKGKEFEDVSQLSGGIQRYLEAFSDGGYFTGKNFVFDHRLAVPSSNEEVVGSCLLCNTPFDDYSRRCRCSLCRMLVLVCTACQVTTGEEQDGAKYICELCREERKSISPGRHLGSQQSEGLSLSREPGVPLSESRDEIKHRKLKVLCLHGFRQSASSLKGRLNALRKKLRQQVEFVYVDAPHEVLWKDQMEISTKETVRNGQSNDAGPPSTGSCADETTHRTAQKLCKKFAWLISPETAAGYAETVPPQTQVGEAVLLTRCEKSGEQPGNASTDQHGVMINKQEFVKGDDGNEASRDFDVASSSVESSGEHSLANAARLESRTPVPQSIQYLSQTDGWSRSWVYLQRVFTELGPFDGVLGFSQGGAVAAALCMRSMVIRQQMEAVNFKFAILCSGFFSPALECPRTAIECPSLHIFGGSLGQDRQIGVDESEKLASLFQPDTRRIVRHTMGHIVPTQPEYVQQYLEFLRQFN